MLKTKKMVALLLVIITVFSMVPIHSFAASNPLYDVNNLLSPSNITAEELEAGLLGNLPELSEAYIKAEKETGVNAIFIAAISALESGWGKSSMARNMNNLFGYGKKTFETKEAGIMHVANALKNNYLTKSGPYYHGYSVDDVAVCYCPGGTWAPKIRQLMYEIGNRVQKYKNEHPTIPAEDVQPITEVAEETVVEEEIISARTYQVQSAKKELNTILFAPKNTVHDLIVCRVKLQKLFNFMETIKN